MCLAVFAGAEVDNYLLRVWVFAKGTMSIEIFPNENMQINCSIQLTLQTASSKQITLTITWDYSFLVQYIGAFGVFFIIKALILDLVLVS